MNLLYLSISLIVVLFYISICQSKLKLLIRLVNSQTCDNSISEKPGGLIRLILDTYLSFNVAHLLVYIVVKHYQLLDAKVIKGKSDPDH